MARVDETTLARRDLVDTIRTIVGLESRIARRHRLNELENDALTQFDAAVSKGEPFVLDRAAFLKALES